MESGPQIYEPGDGIFFPDELPRHFEVEGRPLPQDIAPDTKGTVIKDNDDEVVEVTIPGYPLDILVVRRTLISPDEQARPRLS